MRMIAVALVIAIGRRRASFPQTKYSYPKPEQGDD